MLRILLVDDHEMFRNGMKALIEKIDWADVIAEAEDGADALDKIKSVEIDLVISDIQMPQMDGIKLTRELRTQYPDLKIIILTMVGDTRYIKKIQEVGANGYVTKSTDLDNLKRVIQTVMDDKDNFQISVELTDASFGVKDSGQISSLTSREIDILTLIASGLTDKEIGSKLSISYHTVTSHRRNLLIKLGKNNKIELARYAIEIGLVDKGLLD